MIMTLCICDMHMCILWMQTLCYAQTTVYISYSYVIRNLWTVKILSISLIRKPRVVRRVFFQAYT